MALALSSRTEGLIAKQRGLKPKGIFLFEILAKAGHF
jgi:hypothetical protein